MSNEPLGIYEEARARREKLFERSDAIRARIVGSGPSRSGAYAQSFNPFALHLRLKNNRPPHHRVTEQSTRGSRPIWPEAKLGLNVVQVVQAVCVEAQISAGDLLGDSRMRFLAWPRHVAMWMVDRYCPEYSYPDMGFMFKRDHTSIIHGIDATNTRIANGCTQTKTLIAKVKERLNNIAMAEAG